MSRSAPARKLTTGGVVVAAVVLVAVVWLLTGGGPFGLTQPFAPSPAAAGTLPDLPEPAPGQEAQPGETGEQGASRPPITGQPLRLRIPAVGLDVTVGRMTVRAGGGVNPPTMGSAYWLTGYGVAGPTSTNTAYLAGHTCRGKGCDAAFSPVLDIPHNATTVHIGDQVIVTTPENDWTYTVTDTALYDKPSVPQQAEMWKAVPGRIVLVTCFQYAGGTSSQQNFVVYAQLDPGQA